ncbi:MAG: acetamidase/formamidase family protein [Acidilobaceae archaeon]
MCFPVFVEGALFSLGDAHFAQGNGEVCGTAIEMRAKARLRFYVIEEGLEGTTLDSRYSNPQSSP